MEKKGMETDTEQEDEKEKKEKEQKEEMEALAKKGLAHCFYDALKPYFDKLSDLKLLERCKKMEAAKKGEGTTYQAGGFGDDEGPPRKKAKRSAEPAPKKAAPKKTKKAAPKKPKKAAPRKSAKGGATAWQVVSDKGWTIHCHG